MRRTALWLAGALLLASRAEARTPEIPFERYTLANGLEVILHVDGDVPTVHVEVWYKVGSKDEAPGRTGFAHLFEHVMFQGTKHIPEDAHFKYLAEAGASDRNGSTSFDRTNYYQTLPANQLELGLWLESSRMGFLLERPSFKATFENQREVVKNERRQRIENVPMGGVGEVQLAALYPREHPYHHEIIGSMADLDAATEDDIKRFFARYYAPNNATLLVAGDIDVATTKGLVEKYFGPIPKGPPIKRRPAPAPAPAGERRIAMEAKINLPTQMMTWTSPRLFAPGDAELDVLARVLAGGKTSRLYKRLVYDMKVAQNVTAHQASMMLGGQFEITFTPLPGRTLAEIEKVVDEELERLRREPVSGRELERVKNQFRTEYFRGLESLRGRSSQLLAYNTFAGDPGFIARDLARYERVDAAALVRAAAELLRPDRRLVITVDANSRAPIMGRLKEAAR
jgi:predicted Zn-dependent peptidase